MRVSIDDKLFNEISDYCKLNNIKEINEKINSLLKIGFNIDKYGTTPFPIKKIKSQEEKNASVSCTAETETNVTNTEYKVEQTETKPTKRKIHIIKN